MGKKLRLGALLAILTYAGGCAPSFHASLTEIDEVRAIAENARSMAEQAAASQSNQSNAAAEQMASEARDTANEALSAANAAQASSDANSERLERMFEESQAK